MKDKPDEALSKLLIEKIEKSKLVDKRFSEKLKKGFLLGNLSAEDWELFVEEVPAKEKINDKAN
ncbi:MAG: hypothetical protein HND40_10745 [Ignavibacteriota bacterium]|nr:hypothetical protein [Ignavibacteriota bacterium]MBW7869323.1 hypothetical protein [Brumimicrobium sp.]MCO6446341.1 hypothetical protein [Ignavibacterium album]MCZ2269116.1 hypothetical protein [Ignavibacteriales bacterium]MEB2297845.1 hypothetical protein [Ignavibacteria bacterium]HOJ08830.1 hypothetical protein [Ignavibacteriaceae bacterium]